jgi:hypothetical protein
MRRVILTASLFVAVLAAYWPAMRGAPVWDDAQHMTTEADSGADGLRRIWGKLGTTRQYYPLTHTAFWLERQAFGESTAGYHVVNVLLHATAALLLVAGLARIGFGQAWLAGWLFALHPMMVESVAWISELKNTLSGVLFLGAGLAYLAFEDGRRRRLYGLAAGIYVLALLSKTTTAVLPAILLVVVWWRRGRLDYRRDVLPLLPLVAVGIAAGTFTAWVERTYIGAAGTAWDLTWWQRMVIAGRAPWFYLSKLAWPAGLSFSYPRWELTSWDLSSLGTVVAALVGCALIPRRCTIGPPGELAVALSFLIGLAPALGLVNVFPFRYSFVADHFAYLAVLGPAAGAAWLTGRLVWRPARPMLLAALWCLTWGHAADFAGPVQLYRATLDRNPGSWMAAINLAEQLPPREALEVLERVSRHAPAVSEVWNNMGALAQRLGDRDAAFAGYAQAIEVASDEQTVWVARVNASRLATADAIERIRRRDVAGAALMLWHAYAFHPTSETRAVAEVVGRL